MTAQFDVSLVEAIGQPITFVIPPERRAQMIAAMRRGLGRSPLLFGVPAPVLRTSLRLIGRDELYERLTRSLVVDCSALRRIGWRPSVETLPVLAELMRG